LVARGGTKKTRLARPKSRLDKGTVDGKTQKDFSRGKARSRHVRPKNKKGEIP